MSMQIERSVYLIEVTAFLMYDCVYNVRCPRSPPVPLSPQTVRSQVLRGRAVVVNFSFSLSFHTANVLVCGRNKTESMMLLGCEDGSLISEIELSPFCCWVRPL